MISLDSYFSFDSINIRTFETKLEWHSRNVTCRRGQATSIPLDYYEPGGGGGGGFCVFFSCSLSFFIEDITGRLYNIQNSKLCFRDMKIMSLRNGCDFGKQLVLRTRCLPNHHHSFVT